MSICHPGRDRQSARTVPGNFARVQVLTGVPSNWTKLPALNKIIRSPSLTRLLSTVAHAAAWRLHKFVHVEVAAVADLDRIRPLAVAAGPVEAHFAADHALSHRRVLSIHPSGRMRTAVPRGHHRLGDLGTSPSREAIPRGSREMAVALHHLPVVESLDAVGLAQGTGVVTLACRNGVQ